MHRMAASSSCGPSARVCLRRGLRHSWSSESMSDIDPKMPGLSGRQDVAGDDVKRLLPGLLTPRCCRHRAHPIFHTPSRLRRHGEAKQTPRTKEISISRHCGDNLLLRQVHCTHLGTHYGNYNRRTENIEACIIIILRQDYSHFLRSM